MRFIIVSADREFSTRRFPRRSRLYHTDQFHRGPLKKTCLRETTHFSTVTVLRPEELRREWRWDERHFVTMMARVERRTANVRVKATGNDDARWWW